MYSLFNPTPVISASSLGTTGVSLYKNILSKQTKQPEIIPQIFTYATPIISSSQRNNINGYYIPPQYYLPESSDLNYNEQARNTIIKYFRYKTLDKWLFGRMSDILSYFKVSGNKVEIVQSPDKKNVETMRETDKVLIVEFIEHNILSRSFVAIVIKKYVSKFGVNWYDIHKNEKVFCDYMSEKLKELIIGLKSKH